MNEKIQKDYIKISMPSKPEYVSLARLTASSIANRVGFNIEEIEDIKVAIGEACTNAIQHGFNDTSKNYEIEFYIYDDELLIKVIDFGTSGVKLETKMPDINNLNEGGLGLFIIETLMDEVEYITNENKGSEIRMIKRLEEGV